MEDNMIIGLVCSVLGILCGIIAMLAATFDKYKRMKFNNETSKSIIENHTDAEVAKILLAGNVSKKRNNKYFALHCGLALIGMGVGYLVCDVAGIDHEGFLFIIAAFGGVGLLVAFFIQMHIEKKASALRGKG